MELDIPRWNQVSIDWQRLVSTQHHPVFFDQAVELSAPSVVTQLLRRQLRYDPQRSSYGSQA